MASNGVHGEDKDGDQDAGWFGEPQGGSQEGEGGAVVHWVVGDIEWEVGDSVVHEDAKVVAQVGASDTEGPHGGQNEDVAPGEAGSAQSLEQWLVKIWTHWLLAQCLLIQIVSEDTQREDGSGQNVAAQVSVTASKLGQNLLAVLESSHNVPEGRVKGHRKKTD